MRIKFIQNILNVFKKPTFNKIKRKLKFLHENTQKPIILFASKYSMLTNMRQRPEHILNKFIEKGFIVAAADVNVCNMFEHTNNLYFIPYKFLKKLITDKTVPKIIICISTHPTLKHISKYLNKAIKNKNKVVYEHLDSFDLIPNNGQELKKEFLKVCENDQIIISATSDCLYKEAIEYRGSDKNIILLKNAVNIEDFKIEKLQNSPPPIALEKILKRGKHIIGYYGCIIDSWFDYDLLTKTAEMLPDFEFVCIGIKDGEKVEMMFKTENITYIPKIKYTEIPKYASFFDITIIPFKRNAITDNTSPVKLFEYMALAKPIITTSIEECKKYKSCIIADTPEEFVNAINKALSLKTDINYQNLLSTEAQANTWQERVDRLCELLGVI